jgi:hypothetical protein
MLRLNLIADLNKTFRHLNDSATNITLRSLEEWLEIVGLAPWMSKVTTFVLPVINFLGIFGCTLSLWIFFRKKFVDSIFFYYRLLCAINMLHLLHNIPACVLLSPRYFPDANTWYIAAFKTYYAFTTIFLFHYGDVLQMAILLARMKIYSPFVKKHFKETPLRISISLFVTCLLIDSPLAFAFKIKPYGDYYYQTDLSQQKNATFYYYGGSEFSETKFGKVLLGFFGLFVNMFGSLVAGVTLNIVSYLKYKQYVNERKRKDEEIQMKSMISESNIQSCTGNCLQSNSDRQKQLKNFTQKEINELKAENNMFHMIITLSLISIVSRIILISCNLYGLFFFSLSSIWALVVLDYFIYALVPSVSIFIFIAFNKMFRNEFTTIFGTKRKRIIEVRSPQTSSSNVRKRI